MYKLSKSQLRSQVENSLKKYIKDTPNDHRCRSIARRYQFQQMIEVIQRFRSEEGLSYLAIYTALKNDGVVDYSYQTFMRYSHEMIDGKRREKTASIQEIDQNHSAIESVKTSPIEDEEDSQVHRNKQEIPTVSRSFEYSSKPDPKKLI